MIDYAARFEAAFPRTAAICNRTRAQRVEAVAQIMLARDPAVVELARTDSAGARRQATELAEAYAAKHLPPEPATSVAYSGATPNLEQRMLARVTELLKSDDELKALNQRSQHSAYIRACERAEREFGTELQALAGRETARQVTAPDPDEAWATRIDAAAKALVASDPDLRELAQSDPNEAYLAALEQAEQASPRPER